LNGPAAGAIISNGHEAVNQAVLENGGAIGSVFWNQVA